MRGNTKKMVMGALLASLICVATMIIKIQIPSLFKGYYHLGDSVVLIAGWMFSPMYGFLAAGIGSALADIFSGYVIYAPATFLIKGLMALGAYGVYKMLRKVTKNMPSRVVSGIVAGLIMVLGYYLYEGILYGFVAAGVNVIANLSQGIVGLVVGLVLVKVFEKSKISFE